MAVEKIVVSERISSLELALAVLSPGFLWKLLAFGTL